MVVYISGAMTNVPGFGFKYFDEAAKDLRARGYEVISPAELDDPEVREWALKSPDGKVKNTPNGIRYGDFIGRDIPLVMEDADALVMLEGWEKSKGARIEAYSGWLLDKPIYYYRPDCMPQYSDYSLKEIWTKK
jgi:hypothetical protein